MTLVCAYLYLWHCKHLSILVSISVATTKILIWTIYQNKYDNHSEIHLFILESWILGIEEIFRARSMLIVKVWEMYSLGLKQIIAGLVRGNIKCENLIERDATFVGSFCDCLGFRPVFSFVWELWLHFCFVLSSVFFFSMWHSSAWTL